MHSVFVFVDSNLGNNSELDKCSLEFFFPTTIDMIISQNIDLSS